tara:strand:- start:880 stop:1482 length:603 start_codon:yes stop_codon:yes gene_type:complete
MDTTIINYYDEKVKEYGAVSKGADWNGKKSQYLRFDVLSNIFKEKSDFSLLDYGCGYGEFLSYLDKNNYKNISYTGFDLSDEMITQAKLKFSNNYFTNTTSYNITYDYTILSGTLHVKLKNDNDIWKNHIIETLDYLNQVSKKGFAFNLLTSYSDAEYMKDHLYYASPEEIFKYCKLNFSKNVILDHSYNLYEFTVFVKK